jgi:hypothetical protein
MKNKIFLSLLVLTAILFITGFSFAQEKKKIPIPTLFNTGVDNNNMPLSDDETDPHYTLIVSADERYPGPNAKVVLSDGYPMGCWIQNDNKSKWIAPRTDAGEFNAAGMYVYNLLFSLDGFKPETAEIRGYWTTDNNGTDILINNKSTGFSTPYNAFGGGFYTFEIKEGFVKGINNISFAVYNGEAPTGLRVIIYGEAEPLDVAYK